MTSVASADHLFRRRALATRYATPHDPTMRGDWDHAGESRAFRHFALICGAVAAGKEPSAASEHVFESCEPAETVALVRRHRIAPRAIVACAKSIEVRDRAAAGGLIARARDRRLAALHRVGQMAAISKAFSSAGIRHLGIKGPVLSQQLYGDPAARDSKDIDLLIDPTALRRAAEVLKVMGFRDGSVHAEDGDSRGNKHRTFVGHGIDVEVHTRLLDVEALLPLSFEAVWSRREAVCLGPIAVATLSMADTMLYLSAHGAQHLWFRLKWLEDIARIVAMDSSGMHPGVIRKAIHAAQETGAEPIVIGAVHLVAEVFRIEPIVLPRTRASRRIVALSLAALAAPVEHADAPPLTWILRKLPVQFGMARSWRYRGGLLRQVLLAPRNFDAVSLPNGLQWLRLPLRPAMLLKSRWTNR